jgi:mono/diheme cytochrome c family protein
MIMRGAVGFSFSVALLLAPSAPTAADDAHSGEALYRRYCSACHGPGAKGDGIVATVLRPKPTDLTMIAKNNNGAFPADKIAESIDGRTTLRAHGDPEMPVWGEVLDEEGAATGQPPAEIRRKIGLITDYLKSIQAK